MPGSGRRCVREDRTMGKTSHPSSSPRDQILAPGDPARLAGPHPRRTPGAGGCGRAARPGRRRARVLQHPGRVSHSPPPTRAPPGPQVPRPAAPASSPNSPRPETASAPRDTRASAGRAAPSSHGLPAEEDSRRQREARFRSGRAYEGCVLKLFCAALEQFQ